MMAPTREELSAWADGEISGARAAEIAAAVKLDPNAQRDVEAHRALKARLAVHFAPLLEQPVPERLSALLHRETAVVDLGAARERREEKRRLPRWSWIAGPALAASLALAVFVPDGEENTEAVYAGPQVAQALDTQLTAEQDVEAQTRILLSFRNGDDEFCRAFAAEDASGIVCRDDRGWRFAARGTGVAQAGGEFRQAGAAVAAIMEQAQEMAVGPAFGAGEEAEARAAGWR